MCSKKKILLIENSAKDFLSTRLAYANYLIRNNYDVYAMVPYDDNFVKLIRGNGINVLNYPDKGNFYGLFLLIKAVLKCRNYIKTNDIKLVHSFRFQSNIINVFSTLGKKTKRIIHITGLGIIYSNTDLRFQFLKILSQLVYFLKLYLAHKVVFQNHDDERSIYSSKFFRGKINTVYGSGIDIDYFKFDKEGKTSLKQKNLIPVDKKVFICISRLIWEKGIFELVSAFKSVIQSRSDIYLVVVGFSDKKNPRHISEEFINQITCDSVLFLGYRTDVKELLKMSDVFIYPSYYREGIPRSILEALSMGLPIITTNTPGCNLTVQSGFNGFLVNPRSVGEIEIGIKKILNEDLAQFGQNSRNLAVEKFAQQIIFPKFENLYY